MTKGLVLGALVAAAVIGLAMVFLAKDFPSSGRADPPAAPVAGVAKADELPALRPSASPETKVAEAPSKKSLGKPTQYGHWVLSCMDVPAGAPKNCAAELAIRDNSRNVTVVNWLIGYNKNGELLMEITTPVDVLIAPGLKLAVGDAPARGFPYLSCAATGCLTRFHPDDQLLKDLRQAAAVKLGIDIPAGQTITFSLNIDGIADSLDALAKR